MGKDSPTGSPAGLRSGVGETPGEIHRGTIEDILKADLSSSTSIIRGIFKDRAAALRLDFTGEKDGKPEN